MIAAAVLIAATIAVPTFSNSAYAVQRIVGSNSQTSGAQNANNNGLAGVNAAIGVQANVGQVCVNALTNVQSPTC